MPEKNLQHGNVGNLGDILKHAALVQLASFFFKNVDGKMNYLDSHCYLFQSRLASPNWQVETNNLLEQYPGYQAYIDIEQSYVEQGRYLCSSGLVNQLLPDSRLLLCEANSSTQQELLRQLQHAGVQDYAVVNSLAELIDDAGEGQLTNLLALIDPFFIDDSLWKTLLSFVENKLAGESQALFLIFDYAKTGSKAWPDSITPQLKRYGHLSKQPYYLAVYASDKLQRDISKVILELGWEV